MDMRRGCRGSAGRGSAADAEHRHLAAEGASPAGGIVDRGIRVLHGAHQFDDLPVLDGFILIDGHAHRIAARCHADERRGANAQDAYTARMPSSRKPRKTATRDVHPSLAQYRQKERGERLQKVLADAGVAARRECEKLIVEGAVTVNGKTIDSLPAWVDPATDRIEVYGRPLRPAEKHVYIMLFKPRGTVCTNSDPEGRPRAIDLVNHPSQTRLYCVGRLDIDASGMLILTNDGELANRLTHPRYEVAKGYDVTLDGRLDATALAAIERKIFAAGRSAGAGTEQRSSLRLVSADATKSMVHMELCEHRNLQLRDLMLSVGHPVKKVRRTSFGPLKLKGLAVGEWRELSGREVEMLRKASSGTAGGAASGGRRARTGKPSFAQGGVRTGVRTGTGKPGAVPGGAQARTGKPSMASGTARTGTGKTRVAPDRGVGPIAKPSLARNGPRSGESPSGRPTGKPNGTGKPAPASSRASNRASNQAGHAAGWTGKASGKASGAAKPSAKSWSKPTRTGPRTRKPAR